MPSLSFPVFSTVKEEGEKKTTKTAQGRRTLNESEQRYAAL